MFAAAVQDVTMVGGNLAAMQCFAIRRAALERIGGLRAERFPASDDALEDLAVRGARVGAQVLASPCAFSIGGPAAAQRRTKIRERSRGRRRPPPVAALSTGNPGNPAPSTANLLLETPSKFSDLLGERAVDGVALVRWSGHRTLGLTAH